MKKKMLLLIILFSLLYLLCFPEITVHAAGTGLILWFEQILPSLLPFTILSNIMMETNLLPIITGKIQPLIRNILPVSENGVFVLLSGFLFGFPIGSKNCAAMLKAGKISLTEAKILFLISNNMSPVFIQNYMLIQQLQLTEYIPLTFALLYIPPLLFAGILLKKNNAKKNMYKKTASRSKINFQIIDAGIMNGFETLTKIGGYIMIFSILASFFLQVTIPNSLRVLCIGFTELTNGIHYLSTTSLAKENQYVLAMMFTAFGGLSGIAQTSAMIQGTQLSIKNYFLYKVVLSVITGFLAYCAMKCFGH